MKVNGVYIISVSTINLYLISNNTERVSSIQISYKKLFELMESEGIKKYDLRKKGISPTIINKLIKNEPVNITTIVKICELVKCQPGDILECIDSDGFE